MTSERQKEKQELAKQYVKAHNIEKVVGEMLNSVIHAKADKPLVFMIRYLSKLLPEETLAAEGISVKGPKPRTYPMLIYPEFPENCRSMLKRHLTQNQWQSLRKKKTKHGGNLQFCIRAGTEVFDDPIGVYACDDDAYTRYSAMFMPLIQDLHQTEPSFLSSNLDSSGVEELSAEQRSYVQEIRLTAHRNFSKMPFQPLLSPEDRNKLERRVADALNQMDHKELRGNYFSLNKLAGGDMGRWLFENQISVARTRLLDAAGITENWPEGRGIFVSSNRSVVVKVNFEDHVEVIVLDKQGDFARALHKVNLVLDVIAQSVDPYAQHPKLGYLNASPQNLGHAFQAKVVLSGEAALRLADLPELKGLEVSENGGAVTLASKEVFKITEKDILNERVIQPIRELFRLPPSKPISDAPASVVAHEASEAASASVHAEPPVEAAPPSGSSHKKELEEEKTPSMAPSQKSAASKKAPPSARSSVRGSEKKLAPPAHQAEEEVKGQPPQSTAGDRTELILDDYNPKTELSVRGGMESGAAAGPPVAASTGGAEEAAAAPASGPAPVEAEPPAPVEDEGSDKQGEDAEDVVDEIMSKHSHHPDDEEEPPISSSPVLQPGPDEHANQEDEDKKSEVAAAKSVASEVPGAEEEKEEIIEKSPSTPALDTENQDSAAKSPSVKGEGAAEVVDDAISVKSAAKDEKAPSEVASEVGEGGGAAPGAAAAAQ